MLTQKTNFLLIDSDVQVSFSAEAPYTYDFDVTVTGLPKEGIVFKADRHTRVNVGDTLTVAELAAINFVPTSRGFEETPPWSGQVIYVPQDCGRLPIPLFTDVPAGSVADAEVVITDLPSSGSVFLADGMTALVRDQTITAAQLCGLTFQPTKDAVGQISLLRYRSSDQEFAGEVLLVVGPVVPSLGPREATAAGSSVSPIAVALLLQAGLSSVNSTPASAAVDDNDLLPPDFSTPSVLSQVFDLAVAPVIVGAASEILAQSAMARTDATDSTETNPSPSDRPPHHRIGSSSPLDSGSLRLGPLPSNDLLNTTSPTTTTTSASTQAPPTTSLLNQGLTMGPILLASSASSPSSTTTHWTNSSGGSWDVATNWSAGVPGLADNVVIDAAGGYVVTSTASVDINSLVVDAGVTLVSNPGTLFTVDGDVVDNGTIEAGPFGGGQSSTVEIKGNVSGTGVFDVANQAVLEIQGSVSGQITVAFGSSYGELILDHSAQFQGLIAGSPSGAALAPTDMIDLKDLAFTSSMSTSINYDINSNTSTVSFSNGSNTVTLQFSGKDPSWNLSSDGYGGTIISDPATSPIVLENELPGTPESVWQIDPGRDSTQLEGFTTAISTNIGGTVQFKIDNLTGNPNYQVQIYRLGYYGGDGARLVTTLQHTTSVGQPAPITNAATGEVDAGNWSVTDSWNIPSTAVSGVYVANVVQGTQVFQIPFIVKNPNSTSDIVFQTSDETWQAYNGWGGANLYGGNGPSTGGDVNGAAFAVSYNRPIMTYDSVGTFAGPQDSLMGAEFSAIYWLEENGYDVSYISGMDTATNGSLLLNHKLFMDVGHDEYWTDSQVANVQAAVNAGVNLAFLSGNEIFWQTQFAPSIDGSGTANRTLVSYKDSHFEQLINPSGQGTGTFEAPTSWGGAGMPSNALTGTVFQVDGVPDLGAITIPYGETLLRVWRNTSVANTAPGQTATLASDLLGYEWDSSPDNGFMPVGLVDLSSTTVTYASVYNTEFGNVDTSGTATHNLVEYRNPTSGALVFGAGTVFWSWGLANQSVSSGLYTTLAPDPSVQQATVNLFADMGVQPGTLQASLKIATASTDHTPPISTISSVSTTSPVEGQTVTVTGTATDAGGGVIARVDVSTDGGKTWHPANSQVGAVTENWSYTFNAPAPGTYTIESMAVDDSLNSEKPGAGVSYTVSPSTALGLFSSSATPATANVNDPNAVEVGLKFASSTNGTITGIRFYKGPQNTGTHVVDLWSATGTLLATATSTNETASGWQQVNFSSPVTITAGTTYVGSYHTTSGYSDTPYYFDTLQNPTNGSLFAKAGGLNGVFAYSSGSIFPNNVPTSGDNYWVDVVFHDTGATTTDTPPVLVTQTPNQNAVVGSAFSLTLPAGTFNDPDGGALTYLATGLSGAALPSWLTFNAANQTFSGTPTSANVGTIGVQVTATDPANLSASETFNIAVTTTPASVSLFTASNTPTQTALNEGKALELGVKFTSSVAGQITALKFYRSPGDTGTDLLDLWSSTGTKLASATFTNTTASGWQTVILASPVSISANTTYVASYHTNGEYVATNNFFTNAFTSGTLTAPSSGSSGGNGVYSYGGTSTAGIFPTSTFSASNYYADVVFSTSTSDTPPVLVTQTTNQSAIVGSPFSFKLPAGTFNDPDGGALTYSATEPSWLTFTPATQTFSGTPTSASVGTAAIQVTATDPAGLSASETFNITVGNETPPVLVTQTPNQNATVGSAFSLTLPAGTFNDPDGGALTYSATEPSWLTFNAANQTFSGTPTSANVGTSGVTVTATDPAALSASETFNITVLSTPSSVSLFTASNTPTQTALNDGKALEVGVKFTSSVAGQIMALKFYRSPGDTGTDLLDLWSSTGTKLASATFTNTTASGWQTVILASPVSISANTTYVASYHTNGEYVATNNFFTNAFTSGTLTAPSSGSSGGNGVYSYGGTSTAGIFPTSTFSASNYYADVVFSTSTSDTPPVLVTQTTNQSAIVGSPFSFKLPAGTFNDPDGGALAYSATEPSWLTFTPATQTFSGTPTSASVGTAAIQVTATDPAGLSASETFNITVGNETPPVLVTQTPNQNATVGSAFSLTLPAGTFNDPDGGALTYSATEPSWLTFNAANQTFSGTPTSANVGTSGVTVTATDPAALSASETFNITVSSTPSSVSLFTASNTPTLTGLNEGKALELGVKFTSSVAGQITALKFYRSPGDTGTDLLDLWSSTGTLLASTTFTNTTASGWQTVNLASPVSISANTTYVASYHTNGEYVATNNFFTSALTSNQLTAPSSASSGGNGVYAYGGTNSAGLFPTNSFSASNYYADVVFRPQLA